MEIKKAAYRILMLITTPKQVEKTMEIFGSEKIAFKYQMSAEGTATSEIMDTLGLGSTEKTVVFSIMPRNVATDVLVRLQGLLEFGKVNSGIAFTVPVDGGTKLVSRILEKMDGEHGDGKEDVTMSDEKYSVIAAIVDRGYSTEVMTAAREAGASGGSVIHSRHISDGNVSTLFGFSANEDKEIVLIVATFDSRAEIMAKISERCGIHSEAKGAVISLPIESVVGLSTKA